MGAGAPENGPGCPEQFPATPSRREPCQLENGGARSSRSRREPTDGSTRSRRRTAGRKKQKSNKAPFCTRSTRVSTGVVRVARNPPHPRLQTHITEHADRACEMGCIPLRTLAHRGAESATGDCAYWHRRRRLRWPTGRGDDPCRRPGVFAARRSRGHKAMGTGSPLAPCDGLWPDPLTFTEAMLPRRSDLISRVQSSA
jgi:hypothetical protein